jgi:type II secretory pathway pseudopilin PulG
MFIKRNKKQQSGVILLELIFATLLLALFLAGVAMLMERKERILRNESTSAYLNTILEASETSLVENYSDINNDITTNVNGMFREIDLDNDLIANGYLPRDFRTGQSPYRTSAEIRALKSVDNIELFITLTNPEDSKTFDDVRIASLSPKGTGGIYFTRTAPTNPCKDDSGNVTVCIQGMLGLWSYTPTVDFRTAFANLLPNEGESSVFIKSTIDNGNGSAYVFRKKIGNNLNNNSINTNLTLNNFDNNNEEQDVSIFFNANIDANGKFAGGTQLLYTPGNDIQDTNDVDGDGNTTEIIGYNHPSLTLQDTTNPVLGQPTLSSDGGISTGLVIEKDAGGNYPSCDNAGIIALNKNNNFLHCVNNSWEEISKTAFTREGSVGNIPSTASRIVALIQNSDTSKQYVIVLNRDLSNIPSGHTILRYIGYIE